MWPKHLIFLLFALPVRGPRCWPSLTILATTAALCGLAGCGQQGGLYLPTEPAAAQRATLPETLMPGKRPAPASAAPSANPADTAKPALP